MYYIIKRGNLYWSNIFGWTVKKGATVFFEFEKNAYRPPTGSAWIPLGNTKTDKAIIKKHFRRNELWKPTKN